jgi:hypothetical protein
MQGLILGVWGEEVGQPCFHWNTTSLEYNCCEDWGGGEFIGLGPCAPCILESRLFSGFNLVIPALILSVSVGSGLLEGSAGGDTTCQCEREVECSIAGTYAQQRSRV